MNKIEFVKDEFVNYYKDLGGFGTLQGTYSGASTNVKSCMYALTRMFKPKNVLEIGSWHYDTSN